MASTIIAPSPWALSGNGLVLLYHFPHSFVSRYGYLQAYQHQGYRGWLGAVMLVEYTSSNVGPYQELLFIPGLFRLGGKLCFSISKIYVSTEDSQLNGQRNWGIPKELASFSKKQQPNGSTHYSVGTASTAPAPILEATVAPRGPALPFTSKLLPFTRLVQQQEHRLLQTQLAASGNFRLASLQSIAADAALFPPLQQLTPMATLSISNFDMLFSSAEVVA